jgi:hypothetical protein
VSSASLSALLNQFELALQSAGLPGCRLEIDEDRYLAQSEILRLAQELGADGVSEEDAEERLLELALEPCLQARFADGPAAARVAVQEMSELLARGSQAAVGSIGPRARPSSLAL